MDGWEHKVGGMTTTTRQTLTIDQCRISGKLIQWSVPMVEAALAVDDVDNDGDGKKLETNYLYSAPGWSGYRTHA